MSGGIEVTIAEGLKGFIRKSDLSRDRSEQRPDRFVLARKSMRRSPRSTNRAVRSACRSRREVEEEAPGRLRQLRCRCIAWRYSRRATLKQEESDDGAAEETPAEASEEVGEDTPEEASEEEKPSDA